MKIVRVACRGGCAVAYADSGETWEVGDGQELVLRDGRWRVETPAASGEPQPARRTCADAVRAYLREHYADATLASTARHMCCHPNSLARSLRREGSPGFKELLTQARPERAAELLRSGAATAQEAGLACGYRNMTHFYRVFRERYGVGPGEMRREALAAGASSGSSGAAHAPGVVRTAATAHP